MTIVSKNAKCRSAILLACVLQYSASASEYLKAELRSTLVPEPAEYSVLLPDSYEETKSPFPLILLLHGGGSSHEELKLWQTSFDKLWQRAEVAEAVVVMPNTESSLYMDFKDGSEKWQSFINGPFIKHVGENFNVSTNREHLVIGGTSMGGLGAFRFAFSNPGQFSGVAALEPAIMPALHWEDVPQWNRFFLNDDLLEKGYGKPFDSHFWGKLQPAAIATTNANQISASGLQIYLECGDEDYLNLHDGAEFLHGLLRENQILHEYHLIRGANHLGRTLAGRREEAIRFLDRVLHPPGPDGSPDLKHMIEVLRDAKASAKRSP